jgi:hypothetical protein
VAVVYVGIVVGLDRQGKTTLIGEMKKVLPEVRDRKVVNDPSKHDRVDLLRHSAMHVNSWEKDEGPPIIYDRFPYPDDFIYGGMATWEEMWSWEDAMMRAAKVSLIYVYPPTLTRYMERTQGKIDPHGVAINDIDVVKGILGRYHQFVTHTTFPLLRISSDDWLTEAQAKTALQFILQGALTWESGGPEAVSREPARSRARTTFGGEKWVDDGSQAFLKKSVAAKTEPEAGGPIEFVEV